MQFVLVVDLEPTGVVKAVNPAEVPPASEACLSAIEAAIRAVRISSPLPVPPSMTRLRLRYDLAKLSEQMN